MACSFIQNIGLSMSHALLGVLGSKERLQVSRRFAIPISVCKFQIDAKKATIDAKYASVTVG